MKTYLKHIKSSWQNWVVGKLAKRFANYIKPQWLQGLIGSWQVGNCQLTLPTYQLGLSPCIYWVLSLLVVGNTTPLYKYKDKTYAYPYLFMGFGAFDDPIRASHFNYHSSSKRRSS